MRFHSLLIDIGFPTADTALNNVKQQSKDNAALPRTPNSVKVIKKTDANLTGSKTNDSNLNGASNISTSNHQIDAVKTSAAAERFNRIKAKDSKLNKASYTSTRPLELINELATQKIENINQLNPGRNDYDVTSLICPSGYTYYQRDCRLIITDKECNDSLCRPFSYCDELNECVCKKGYMFETNSLSSNNCVPIPQTGNTSGCPGFCPEGYQCGKQKTCEKTSQYKFLRTLYSFEDVNNLEKESSKVDEKYLTFYFLIGLCCIIFALLFFIIIIFRNKLRDLHQSNMRAIKMPYNTSTSTTTTETTLFNLLANFEDNITESPLCKLQIPSWLNIWCVLITICLLIMIGGFVLMLSHIRYYRQRQLQFNRIPGTPEYYSEHFLDRSHIMVY
uniref:EB domain-containing protein n=1 Tax=Glossina palpalis gambiensis TaxID=67801 RepID=A0A1B0B0R2_9MUSC